MAKKQIKKLDIHTYGDTKQILGIELPNGSFLSEKGTIIHPRQIKKVSQTRTNSATKEIFYDMYNICIRKEKLEKERDEAIRMIRQLQDILQKMPDKIQNANGFLSYQEFIGAFANALPKNLKQEIDRFAYRFETPMGICYSSENAIMLSRFADIQKYYHGVLTEQEYDGTYQLRHNCEKDREYKRLLQKYSKPLSVKQKINEGLTLGDKDWLSYSGFYQIPIKKNMTAEYAKNLAASFSKQ